MAFIDLEVAAGRAAVSHEARELRSESNRYIYCPYVRTAEMKKWPRKEGDDWRKSDPSKIMGKGMQLDNTFRQRRNRWAKPVRCIT